MSNNFSTIIADALHARASDIHFEPTQNTVSIRFRIDGLLTFIENLPKTIYAQWLIRFKTLANLDIAQSLRPQDGRFSFETTARYHFRLHTCPTIFGEKMVIRLLPESQQILSLTELGLHSTQHMALQKALQQRWGLIIVTGPTGSGKSMTLYACLQWLKTQPLQITTLEDPVEIPLEGTTQIAIQEKQGLTFSNALRAVLRQDPDVILVGEMRDFETADIAIRAALTGHLVLTTLHTPNAASALRRLENMNIPTYNLADSLSLVVSQRLARRVDRGRIGIFEIMTRDQHYIDDLTLRESGYLHVSNENTTLQEIERVL